MPTVTLTERQIVLIRVALLQRCDRIIARADLKECYEGSIELLNLLKWRKPMPNCFTLTRKGESEPTTLFKVDEELCTHLGVEVHPEEWVASWYDLVGFAYSMGKTHAEVEEIFQDERLRKINAYLEEHFLVDAWYQPKGGYHA